jgi:hypothetical protein
MNSRKLLYSEEHEEFVGVMMVVCFFFFYVVLVVLELRSKLLVALELAGVADSGMA